MIMKTKLVKSSGQMVRRGEIEKLPGGQRGQLRGGANGANCQGEAKGAKLCTGGGALPLLPYSYSPPLPSI